MSLRTRLNRLERDAGQGGCPECRDRQGLTVVVSMWEEPDGSERSVGELPAPCLRCGETPETILELVYEVVHSANCGEATGIPQG